MEQPYWLIVDRVSSLGEERQELTAELSRRYRINAYTIGQRLIGHGPALFAKGEQKRLKEIAADLNRFGLRSHLLQPSAIGSSPARMLGIAISQEAITFATKAEPVTLPRGATVLAVVTDLSGQMIEKNLRRLMAQHAYRGADHISQIGDGELYRSIIRGAPVLDIYLLTADGTVDSAVRIFAGRFDPKGLGSRKSYSAGGNIDSIVGLLREYAGNFRLDSGFGLARIPGCQLNTAEGGSDRQRNNLTSLTRYGWLMADLWAARQRNHLQDGEQKEGPSAADPAAAALLSPIMVAAATIAGEGETAVPGLFGKKRHKRPDATVKAEGLPAPPEVQKGGRPWRFKAAQAGVVALVAALVLAGRGEGSLLRQALAAGTGSGLLPGLLGGLMFWGGFFYLRLKRRVENTPTSKVRSMAMGMVEVHGRALRCYALVSPMSQMPCVYYRLRKYCRSGGREGGWRLTSESSSGHVPFLLDDGTGRVRVNPWGATVKARTRNEDEGLLTSARSDDGEKWVEEVVPEGTSLYVLGFARPRRNERPSLRGRTIEALRELKLDKGALQRYDSDGDGQISHQEWESARTDVEQQVARQSLSGKGHRPDREEQAEIGSPGSRSLPFIIAETACETHLAKKYGLLTLPLFAGAILCAVWALTQVL